MTITATQFANQLATLLHLSSADTTSLVSLVQSWDPSLPSDLANNVVTFVNAAGLRDTSYNNWAVGTATGGPNGDGNYPINVFGGGTVMLPSIAKLLTTVTHGADAKTGVAFSIIGPMNPNELLEIVSVSYPMVIDTANISGYAINVPTADTTFIVQKNGSAWGTVTFAAGYHNHVTQSFSSNTVSRGDAITLLAPATPDATLQNFAVTLPGVAS